MIAKHSESLILVWRVAAAEARGLGAPKIEPAHLFLGLCKVVDLEIPDFVSKMIPNRDEVLEEFLREVRRLRSVFKLSCVDPKALRRHLRAAYGKDSLGIVESEPMRRSDSAKHVFSVAELYAEITSFVVFPIHLLSASLSTEDLKRDSAMAAEGIDKDTLVQQAKEEMFARDNVEIVRQAEKKVSLN
jgi:hypothetical protein